MGSEIWKSNVDERHEYSRGHSARGEGLSCRVHENLFPAFAAMIKTTADALTSLQCHHRGQRLKSGPSFERGIFDLQKMMGYFPIQQT